MGGTALLAGLVMLITPGPGMPVILVALAILATEFLWARHWLNKCRKICDRAPLPRKPRAWMRWIATRSRPPARKPTTPIPRWMP